MGIAPHAVQEDVLPSGQLAILAPRAMKLCLQRQGKKYISTNACSIDLQIAFFGGRGEFSLQFEKKVKIYKWILTLNQNSKPNKFNFMRWA